MEDKNLINGNEICDLGIMSRVTGGVGGMPTQDMESFLAAVKRYKSMGYTLDKVLDDVRKSDLSAEDKYRYIAVIVSNWDSL